ncbi:hypothetical protein D3C72_468490 [compost metagenome]
MKVIIDIGQAVFQQSVDQQSVSHLVAFALLYVMGRIAHAFHAARNYDSIDAKLYLLGSEHDGFHARGTYFIDGGSIGFICNSGKFRGLSGWRLSEIGAQYIAHIDRVDRIGWDVGFLQYVFNGKRSQFYGRQMRKCAEKASDGRSLS